MQTEGTRDKFLDHVVGWDNYIIGCFTSLKFIEHGLICVKCVIDIFYVFVISFLPIFHKLVHNIHLEPILLSRRFHLFFIAFFVLINVVFTVEHS